MSKDFTGLPTCKYKFRQVLFAYRLCTGELTGPTSKLVEALEESPLLRGVGPEDIINTLRPLATKGIKVSPFARASKMLAIQLTQAEIAFNKEGISSIPCTSYTIQVSYCMRIHRVQRNYDQFQELHKGLSQELVVLPDFPLGGGVSTLFGGKEEEGRALCQYLQRIHTLLAWRGVFSPRVMDFLEACTKCCLIDFGRVHIEEEGRVISQNLDSRNLLPNTCWQVVEESWLVKWTKFVLSQGARRYLPPGSMNNEALMEAQANGLVLGQDYRVVNHNVWRYWMLVYGGGPCLGRSTKDIYSMPAIAYSDAVFKVQSVVRGFLARNRFWREYFFKLATEHAGAKEARTRILLH
ncbi:unnamed protein product, partial [Choristocarpus tenellus]